MCACEPESYPSDLTDAQWELIAPMVGAAPGRAPGDPSAPSDRGRDLVSEPDGLLVAPTLPHDFPPWETVYWYFKTWTDDGLTDRIHDALRAAVRECRRA